MSEQVRRTAAKATAEWVVVRSEGPAKGLAFRIQSERTKVPAPLRAGALDPLAELKAEPHRHNLTRAAWLLGAATIALTAALFMKLAL